jgi:16S rRNA (guanine527-N7)-methyltransferase
VTSRAFKERLLRRAKRFDLVLDSSQIKALEQYVRLLARWNEKINLTALAVAEPDDHAIDRLLIEPLLAARYLREGAPNVIDIGSGSGSPAVPLKIAAPAMHLTMVESKTRKAVFLTEVLRELGMAGTVETARFEHLLARPELHESADVVTMRAVRAELRTFLSLQAFVRPGGQVFWFKSSGGTDQNVPAPLRWAAAHSLADGPSSQLIILNKDLLVSR